MSNTKTVYRFDSAGYYLGTSLAQYDAQDLLLPPDCTETKPALKDGNWYKWTGKSWSAVKIPTTCADAIDQNLTCISNGPGLHNLQVKAVIETLVANESENYRTVVSSDFVMSIEAIPEKTLDKLKAEKLEALSSYAGQFDQYKCNEMYVTSSIGGYKFNADIRSQTNMQGLIDVLADDATTLYKDYDNEFRTMTKADLAVLRSECLQNGQHLYQQKWAYRAQINACTTKEELAAITFDFKMKDFS
jgi:hypothetical protein